MKASVLFLLIFLIWGVHAACENGQIDINSATLEELDEIYGVGPAIAQNIIDARPYETIDGLVNAKGIGEVRLAQIKEEGIVCVEDGIKEEEKIEETNKEESKRSEVKEEPIVETPDSKKITGKGVAEVIKLDAKSIKSENDTQKGSKTFYYLGSFMILLGLLFLVRGRRQKTEFDE